MLHICCVRAGTRFPPEYVSILVDSVRRNLAEGTEGEFVCFTDQSEDLPSGVVKRPLPPLGLAGWWNKLWLFAQDVFPEGSRVLYFDLACLITGPIDALTKYDGPFAVLKDFYRPNGLQSSVMAWTAGECVDIWEHYVKAGFPQDFKINGTWGDQAWIERVRGGSVVRLQKRFPDMFASYKADRLDKNPPAKASVVIFHGQPKPHEIGSGWVPQVWKIGGLMRAELDTVCNTNMEKLLSNVRHSIGLDLPWMDTALPHDEHVVIVGGGPSLKEHIEEIAWRQSIGQKVWALNNAACHLFVNGIMPDAQIIADARPENAEFIGHDHGWEVYVASQCDKAIFRKLKEHAKVTLWHCNTPGIEELLKDVRDKPVHLFGGGSTVALNATVIAFGKGYRKFHLYGLDSSYRGDEHHAYPQGLNEGERVVDALCAGKTFKCAPWMVQQATEFEALARELLEDDCIITVAGDGLLPTLARDIMATPTITASDLRAEEILKRILDIPNPVGAEIGVFAADLSRTLLKNHRGLKLYMIDSWEPGTAAYAEAEGAGDWHCTLTQEQQDKFYDLTVERTNFAADRREIIRERSVPAAAKLNGTKLDFAFIDADHSYEGCKADIDAWFPKIKSGGWLCGHDYANTEYPLFGVTRAIDEFAKASGLKLELGENFTWFMRVD